MSDTPTLLEPSILTTIKKLLGLTTEYTAFDLDIIVHINSVLSSLTQMGIGPEEGFMISGYEEKWDQYIPDETKTKLQEIKTLVYQKVRLIFDPPSNGTLFNALEKSIKEIEYRLYVEQGGY